ncbi:MAG: hypothetical protein AAF297_06015 [Planctomycetota bacterium]
MSHSSFRAFVVIAVSLVLGVGVCGCARRGGGGESRAIGGAGELGPTDVRGLTELGPFAPDSMRVYPLTHVEAGEGEDPRIVLHLELRDRWGDTVKGTGRVRVRLYRGDATGGLAGAAQQRQELVWDVDLTDLRLNASLFDPSTRTYRVVLGELPEWADAFAEGGPGGNEGVGQAVTLVVVWVGRDADGEVVSLRDVYRLGG